MFPIYYERSRDEALFIQNELLRFGVNSEVKSISLDSAYSLSPSNQSTRKSGADHLQAVGSNFALIVTDRDVYASSAPDSWVFGYCMDDLNRTTLTVPGTLFFVCTARLKGDDELPSSVLKISKEEYLARVFAIAIHEIAHVAVSDDALVTTQWVGDNGYVQELGPHCPDNRCLLYEVVGLHDPTDGSMKIGGNLTKDAGLNALLKRRYPNYFCSRCYPQVVNYLAKLSTHASV